MTDLKKWNTIKLLEGNAEEKLCDPGFGNELLSTTPKAQFVKKKNIKLILLKFKTSALWKAPY